MKKWYEVVGYKGHCGTKKSIAVKFYIYAKDISELYEIYKRVPGMKDIKRYHPNIRECEKKEEAEILRQIKEKGVSLKSIKKFGWFFSI